MKESLLRHCVFKIVRNGLVALAMSGSVSALAAASISNIDIRVDGDADIPRVLDLLGVKEGDTYSEAEVERGLIRLADSGKFLGLESSFDPASGDLVVQLKLVPRTSGVDVHLKGIEAVPETLDSDVRDVTGLSPGDAVFPDQLSSIRERVLTRLHDRGYPNAQVVVSLEQRTGAGGLRVVVAAELGSRSMVRTLELQGFHPRDADELFDALKLPGRILPLGLSGKVQDSYPVNFPFDAIRLDEAIASWNQKARADGYYDFQLKSVHSEGPNGIVLRLSLEKGPRFILKFLGNTAFWSRELRAKVTDRPLRLGVPLNLQDAETLILREYESAGYPEAQVKVRVMDRESARWIYFDINEGRKLLLGKVSLPGVPDAEAVQFQRIVDDWLKQYRDPLQRMPFDEKFIKAELPKLLARIRSLGYLEARILEMRPLIPSKGSFVDVELPVQLGDKYTVRSVAVTGNISLSPRELDQIVNVSPGDAADPTKIMSVREQLFRKYQDIGFLNVSIDNNESRIIKRNVETNEVDVEYSVDQGPLIRVGKTVLEGLRRTKERVVLRELSPDTLGAGSIWTPSGAELLEQRLLSTNIFGNVSFTPVGGRILSRAAPDGTSVEVQEKDLKISLTEKPAGSFEFGPGFRTDRGLIGFAQFDYRNLGGWNRGIQTRAEISRRLVNYQFIEKKLSLAYLEPYIFNQRLGLRFDAQYQKADETVFTSKGWRGYNVSEQSFGFSTEANLTSKLRWIQNLYTFSRPQIFYPSAQFTHDSDDKTTIQESQRLRIASIGTSFIYDNRDNFFNPTTGWLLSTDAEYGSPFLGSQNDANYNVNYALSHQQASTYFRLAPDNVIALSLSYAHVWSLGSATSIPLTKRLALGGYTSLRSLKEQALRFDQSGVTEEQSFDGKIEYRQPVFYGIGMAYFVDLGELDAYKMGSTGLRWALGVGFRYKTVVGPLAVDVAYNVNPAPKSAEDTVHISISVGAF